ncbi:oxidoreductase [Fodinicola acaciae]|uniref:oxidoreductase n=1 Tax=Fodinicola acaciae TaxID=2681555 RepID=UPI0013D4815B|nr:oxidoreductase [Fodinicola acaciae]
MTDVLRPLLDLPEVAEAAEQARQEIDRLFGHNRLRRQSAPVSAEAALRGAHASAALEGASYDLEAVRSGAVTDSVVQGALRVSGALGSLAETWGRAPRQALARLHLLAARDILPEEQLGRPSGDVARLDALMDVLAAPTEAPAVVVAAVVHGEILTSQAFPGPNGVVARAASRLVLIQRGLDPKAVSVPDAGHLAREPEYRGAAGTYATGTPDGVRAWLKHCCAAVAAGAAEGRAICDRVSENA